MPRLLRTEQEHHGLAFERYYGMGSRGSYDAVAEALGASATTVKLWERSFNWSARVRDRGLKLAGRVAERSVGDRVVDRWESYTGRQARLITEKHDD